METNAPPIGGLVWNEVLEIAGVEDKTPHSARHAMGNHIMEKTGNVAAVQRQLGHKNAIYSMEYSRITAEELREVINDR
jgi:integrase